jgi:hypothetical protein
MSARGPYRAIHVRDEIAGPLDPKRIGDGRFETEHRQRSDRCEHQLRQGLTGGGSHLEHAPLGFRAAERGDEAVCETVKVLRCDVDVGRVVLRANRTVVP